MLRTLIVRRPVLMLSLSLLSLLLLQCGGNLFAVSEDVRLGKQISEQINSNPSEYPILKDASTRQYLQNMVNEILRSPKVRYRGQFAYKVQVVHDDETLNAFATPGGYIYVYTGLMKFLDNEASLAGVLGHEIAHAEHRHSTKRMTKAYGYQLLLSVILGEDPDQAAVLAGNLFSGLALLHNSREDESESDRSSFEYLQSTRWYPGGAMYFFEKIQKRQKSSGGAFERLLSTHPLPQDRVDAFRKMISAANLPKPSEANLFAKKYRQQLQKIPPSVTKGK